MFAIEVNGQTIEAKKGETILQTLTRAGIHVPTLCHMEGLLPSGACRMCVVEVEGSAAWCPSCSYPVAEGMKIQTNTPEVLETRKTIVELLLSNHPDDCLYCVRNGNCDLAKLAAEHGVRERVFRGERSAAAEGHLQPVHHPRSGQVHPLRQVRPRLRGNPGRLRHRLHQPRLQGLRRHGLRPGPERLQLHQLRPVHPGLPDRRALRAQATWTRCSQALADPEQDRGRPARPGRLRLPRRGIRLQARHRRRRQDGRGPAPGRASTGSSTPPSPPTSPSWKRARSWCSASRTAARCPCSPAARRAGSSSSSSSTPSSCPTSPPARARSR